MKDNAGRAQVDMQGVRVCSSGWPLHCTTMLGVRQESLGGTEVIRKSEIDTEKPMCNDENNQVSKLPLWSQFRMNLCQCAIVDAGVSVGFKQENANPPEERVRAIL